MGRHADWRFAATDEKERVVVVDWEKACFSTWHEMFPRSCFPDRVGTEPFGIAKPGFLTSRQWVSTCGAFRPFLRSAEHPARDKGKNNWPVSGPDDPESP